MSSFETASVPLPRRRVALVIAWAALLGACGFHLQGREPLPPTFATPCIETDDPQSDFIQGLRKALVGAGAQIQSKPAGASAVIHVLHDQLAERVLSVSSRNIPREYELVYKVRYSVSAGDKELLAAQDVSATRDFSFDETQVLAKQREQDILREALARDLVALVVRRISSL
jgi:LPS-assembly lipoprotein